MTKILLLCSTIVDSYFLLILISVLILSISFKLKSLLNKFIALSTDKLLLCSFFSLNIFLAYLLSLEYILTLINLVRKEY